MTETASARTFTTRKGKSVVSRLTNEEAFEIVSQKPSAFAQDLTKKSLEGMSFDQVCWLHILANQADTTPVKVASLVNVFEMLARAGAELKKPKIRVLLGDGPGGICLSEYNSAVYVKDANKYEWSDRFQNDVPVYYGKITDGEFLPSHSASTEVAEAILRFAENPLEEAERYGRLTGCCCFCGRKLTDKLSTANGYGPICAKRFGL